MTDVAPPAGLAPSALPPVRRRSLLGKIGLILAFVPWALMLAIMLLRPG